MEHTFRDRPMVRRMALNHVIYVRIVVPEQKRRIIVMDYKGVIIEESLKNKNILKQINVLKTKVEKVTPNHKTPWLKQWTMHTVKIPEDKADSMAEVISNSLDYSHAAWYADYKNDMYHYIIFKNKVFKVNRGKPDEYQTATDYGISLGIPDYQVDFSPHVKIWKR